MKRIAALILVLVLVLGMVGCGKSDAAKNVENLILAIGEPANVSVADEGRITAAREAYDALSDKDKQAVYNQSVLAEAENALVRNEFSECLDCLYEYRKACDALYAANTEIWKNVNSYVPGSNYGGVVIDMFIGFIDNFDDPSKTLEEYVDSFAERSKAIGSPITLSLYEITMILKGNAICVDNPLHLDRALALVRSAAGPDHIIKTCSDGSSLLRIIRSGASAPDVAVLDIKLGDVDGIKIAGTINRLLPECQIIFLTGYAEYAPDAYTTEHVWFVLKDRVNEHLPAAVEKALTNLENRSTVPELIFRLDRKTYRVSLAELVYIERVGRKYRLVGRSKTFSDAHLVSDLSDPCWKGRLIRCHQGFWAAEPAIHALDRNEVVLNNGDRLPISRTCRDAVRELFFAARRL